MCVVYSTICYMCMCVVYSTICYMCMCVVYSTICYIMYVCSLQYNMLYVYVCSLQYNMLYVYVCRCQEALDKNEALIGEEQYDYQRELTKKFKDFQNQLQPMVSTHRKVSHGKKARYSLSLSLSLTITLLI